MTTRPAATLRSRYVEQAASDLEENRRLQRELTSRISALRQEEAMLMDILRLAERYEGLPDPSPVPDQTSVPDQASSAVSDTKGTPRRSLLGSVLLELLAGHDEPRLAKEVREELLAKHPDRSPTPQVVRNTLESLVAKGRVQRHKQQRAVLYSLAQRPELRVSSRSKNSAGPKNSD
ncbi:MULTISPECIES: BlaI/MecI/CopY family transcriptional regulator [unclassified Streptomyces]|uniref:BlaI/MecI/CopY family transcriptional regulator n=1 Tax=unclassified Streptomyces TaxID=2593676 RepID=UPI00224F0F6D|nr:MULTISPECIES: BlaI/MecI/CopY family transcriptional regulator [unclassified Streptomyces]MCX5285443.1 BlaI/MecI/CopY family transcriptional regulator [Streptomyces sp. NBC_00198]